jgi:C_GCAxxG_C_C family probable redox protein
MYDTQAQRAMELFQSGYYCAESVLLALVESNEIDSEIIPQIATGFCSGVARTGDICGAVAGAIMGIGLKYGRKTPQDPREQCYQMVRSLLGQFSEQFGGTTCLVLTGVHLDTEEGQAEYKANQTIQQCTQYVGYATRLVIDLGEENPDR